MGSQTISTLARCMKEAGAELTEVPIWCCVQDPSPSGPGLQGDVPAQPPPRPTSPSPAAPWKHPDSTFLTSMKVGTMAASRSPRPRSCPSCLWPTLPTPLPSPRGLHPSLLAEGSFWSAHLLLAPLPASGGVPDVSSSAWLPALSSLSVSSAPPASQGRPSVTPPSHLLHPAEAPDEAPRPPQGAVSLADLLCSDSTSRCPCCPVMGGAGSSSCLSSTPAPGLTLSTSVNRVLGAALEPQEWPRAPTAMSSHLFWSFLNRVHPVSWHGPRGPH